MAVAEDLEFQFETLFSTLVYEKEYKSIKAQKMSLFKLSCKTSTCNRQSRNNSRQAPSAT